MRMPSRSHGILTLTALCAASLTAGCERMTCSQRRVRSIQYMNQGVDFYRQGSMPAAIRELKSAVAEDDSNIQAHYNLAKAFQEMKQWEDALPELQRCVAAQQQNAMFHYDLGWTLDELNRDDNAAEAYKKALAIDPKLFRAHYRLGTVLESQDRLKEADASYRRAIEINARFTKPFIRLGYLYLNNDFAREAAAVFKAGLSVDEMDGEMQNGYGAALAALGQFDEATTAFQAALKLDNNMLDALYNLGMAHFELGHKEQAKKYLEEFSQRGQGRADPAFVRAAQDKLSELMGLGASPTTSAAGGAGLPAKVGKAPPP